MTAESPFPRLMPLPFRRRWGRSALAMTTWSGFFETYSAICPAWPTNSHGSSVWSPQTARRGSRVPPPRRAARAAARAARIHVPADAGPRRPGLGALAVNPEAARSLNGFSAASNSSCSAIASALETAGSHSSQLSQVVEELAAAARSCPVAARVLAQRELLERIPPEENGSEAAEMRQRLADLEQQRAPGLRSGRFWKRSWIASATARLN